MSMTSTVSNTVHPEEYLHLVDTVISLYITQRIDIADMEYADLYQTGCLALCHAAATYDPEREASFSTYASVVIRNRLYDYCRHVNHVHSQLLYLDAPLADDSETAYVDQLQAPSESPAELFPLLQIIQEEYSGIAAKGVNALLLQASGYSSKDIAAIYHVKPNHISAWISRARSRLQKDPRVLAFAQ